MIENSKKVKNNEIAVIIISSMLFLIIGLISIFRYTSLSKPNYAFYEENSNLDYKVYLKNNSFYNEKYLEKGNKYIASLIDYMDVSFNSKILFENDFNFKYSYKIVADTKVVDKYDKNSIYEN